MTQNDDASTLLLLAAQELLEIHRLLDTLRIPRTSFNEALSASQRVANLVGCSYARG